MIPLFLKCLSLPANSNFMHLDLSLIQALQANKHISFLQKCLRQHCFAFVNAGKTQHKIRTPTYNSSAQLALTDSPGVEGLSSLLSFTFNCSDIPDNVLLGDSS